MHENTVDVKMSTELPVLGSGCCY